jgi:hypothetical protein
MKTMKMNNENTNLSLNSNTKLKIKTKPQQVKNKIMKCVNKNVNKSLL